MDRVQGRGVGGEEAQASPREANDVDWIGDLAEAVLRAALEREKANDADGIPFRR